MSVGIYVRFDLNHLKQALCVRHEVHKVVGLARRVENLNPLPIVHSKVERSVNFEQSLDSTHGNSVKELI